MSNNYIYHEAHEKYEVFKKTGTKTLPSFTVIIYKKISLYLTNKGYSPLKSI